MRYINKESMIMTGIWSICSISGCIRFMKLHYAEAMNSPYQFAIGKTGQYISAVIAAVIAILMIYAACNFFYRAEKEDGKERAILRYALPILIVLVAYLLTDIASVNGISPYYSGDEKNIWDSAVRMYPFIFVYSGELFMICFYILPIRLAPSIIKILFSSYVFGYVIYRAKRFYDSKYVYFLYCIFAMKPFLEYGIRVHRMHWYGVLYLLAAAKLYFDYRERNHHTGTMRNIVLAEALLSILTIWRREGIYLIVWGLLLLLVIYGEQKERKKSMGIIAVSFLAMELLISLPETVYESTRDDALSLADGNVTYQAYLVHMLAEENFDRQLCAEELDIIDKFMDIERIDLYNTECRSEAFNDCYWSWGSWRDGKYYAIRNGFTIEEYGEFKGAVVRMIKKQPLVFLRSRIKAFAVCARSRDSYNLFLPLILTFTIFCYGIKEKDICISLLFLGILGHVAITVLTMPASYFKYFYEMFTCAYVFAALILLDRLERRKCIT